MGYIRPVPFTGRSSWYAHTRRRPPSQEAGVDYYCPIGTPLVAAGAGVVVDVSLSIGPPAGRFVTVDLGDGRRVRYLHLQRIIVRRGERVARGQVIAYTGASGYGEEDWSWNPATGGAHVHTTLWPFHRYAFGVGAATLDFEKYADQDAPAGGGSTPFDPEEDELNDTQAAQLAQAASDAAAAKHALFYGGNWQNSDGSNQVAKYGVLPIVIHNQGLIAKQAGRLAAIEQVVEQLATSNGAVLDMDAIAAAAERGAEKALEGLTLKAV